MLTTTNLYQTRVLRPGSAQLERISSCLVQPQDICKRIGKRSIDWPSSRRARKGRVRTPNPAPKRIVDPLSPGQKPQCQKFTLLASLCITPSPPFQPECCHVPALGRTVSHLYTSLATETRMLSGFMAHCRSSLMEFNGRTVSYRRASVSSAEGWRKSAVKLQQTRPPLPAVTVHPLFILPYGPTYH